MMIKQRKHNIRLEKPDNTSIIRVEDSPTCANKFRIGDIRSEDKASLLAQSTPKRSDSSTSKSQDGSDSPDYRTSFPLTQDENIEVTWDWHRSARKDSNEITTPKRATIKRRKRPPSSPLAYKPIRKQLIKQENKDGINQFKAEMIALAKRVQSGHNSTDTKKSNDKIDGTNVNVPIKIFEDFNDNEADIVVTLDNVESPQKIDQSDNKSVDDLFNDSMDEAIIRFSQETEKKLNISPTDSINITSVSTKILHRQNSNQASNYLSELAKNGSSNGESVKKPNHNNNANTKNKNQPQKQEPSVSKIANKNQWSNTSTLEPLETPRKQTATLKTDDLDFFILDDSFDDFIASCNTDVRKNEMRSSITKPTGVQTHSSNHKSYISNMATTSKEYVPKVSNKLPSTSSSLKPPSNVSKNSMSSINTLVKNPAKLQIGVGKNNMSDVNSVTKTAASQTGVGKTTNVQSAATPARTWKFFKSKSHSDSNFNNNENQTGTNSKQDTSGTRIASRTSSSSSLKGRSSSNVGSKGGSRIYGGKVVSNDDQPVQRARTTSCLDSNVTNSIGTQKGNINMYNVDRCRAERGNGDSRSGNEGMRQQSSITSGVQSMQLQCTPAEIERKRLEALKKLEARKKRNQANTTVDSRSAPSYCQQISVNR